MNPQQLQSIPQQPVQDAANTTRQQVAEQIKGATNVLVTVSANPSVDQLASAIGLTIVLNKLGKHATAVFSGKIPSTIEFLQPEKTLEKNTDSLRDFIIALDKAKADKLRYKVEDKFVKIFITPYRTNLSEKDLVFSQGDFNVDVVLALGVKKQQELDQSITAHGRILHDATVISINHLAGANLGVINWNEPSSSSLCEIIVNLCDLLITDQKPEILDKQTATAFLTGIVAETERFSNDKTSSQTMSIAGKLMKAGANQQLIATKLEEPKPIPQVATPVATLSPTPAGQPVRLTPSPQTGKKEEEKGKPITANTDGLLQIMHDELGGTDEEDPIDKIHIDEQGTLSRLEQLEAAKAAETAAKTNADTGRKVSNYHGPDTVMSAGSVPEQPEPSTDPLSSPDEHTPLLGRHEPLHSGNTLMPTEASVHKSEPAISNIKSTTLPNEMSPKGLTKNHASGFPQLVAQDKGLPTDKTAGSATPSAPPQVPPQGPPPMMPPHTPSSSTSNSSNPNTGAPL